MLDIVLKGGLVVDPANRIMSKLNIGIKDKQIAVVTTKQIVGKKQFDCNDLIIAPGFVDIHIHEDAYDSKNQRFNLYISKCMLRMGVTSMVGGNCGIGPLDSIYYLKEVDRLGYPVNIGLLTAHGSLRKKLGQFDKYKGVDDDTISGMCDILDKELEQGSLGLSFGIRYIPGLNNKEMLSLCKVVKKHDKIVAAHVRNDAAGVIEAIIELINIGKETGVKLQISHIGSMAAFGQMEDVYRMIDHWVANGMDIGIDCYPYNAFCTAIGSTTFDKGFLERYNIDYYSIEMTQGKYKGQRLNNKTFEEIRENKPDYLAIAHVMKEEEIDMALTHPRTILASDGMLNDGYGHPRAAGSFPRFIREFVVNKKIIGLHDAVEKMTILPATRFGLNKGSLSIGADADIVVFDLKTIRDQATFTEPLKGPEGIKYVFVQGKLAVVGQDIINGRLGRPIY